VHFQYKRRYLINSIHFGGFGIMSCKYQSAHWYMIWNKIIAFLIEKVVKKTIWLQVNASFIWNLNIKLKCKKSHTFKTVPKYNRKFVETKSKSTTLHTMYSTWLSSFLVSSNYLSGISYKLSNTDQLKVDAAEMLVHNYLSKWVTDCCLTLTQLYQCENKLIFNEMMMMMMMM
jgi:hypothetical protein